MKFFVIKLDTETGDGQIIRTSDSEFTAKTLTQRFNKLAERGRETKFVGFDNIVYIYAPCEQVHSS